MDSQNFKRLKLSQKCH